MRLRISADTAQTGAGRLAAGLQEAWSIGVPYWRSEDRWRAGAQLAVIIVLNLGLVGTTLVFTYWQGVFYNALEAKDWNGFIGSLLWWHYTPKDGFTPGFAPTLAVFVLMTVYELYLRQGLQIRWRRWMSDNYIGDWLSDRTYFRMALMDTGTDNPDQRIAEDIRLFVDNTLLLGLGVMRSVAALFAFVFFLWTLSEPVVLAGVTIHGYLVWIALIYAIAGTWLAHLVGRKLTPLHYTQQKAEADFRFSLMRFSENVEGIALHSGELEQERELSGRFWTVVTNWRAIMIVTRRLTFLTTSYAQIVLVFPFLVVAPAYFAGRMALGGIFQTSNAFVQVQNALSWVVSSYADLTGWFATVHRLSGFRRSVEAARRPAEGPVVTANAGDQLELWGVELTLPNGDSLLSGLDLSIPRGDTLLIKGPSGCGKSTLLRAIAGIWPFGSGSIRRASGRTLFLPQRPYMPLGSLKRALCYPLGETEFSDSEVGAELRDAGLDHLAGELRTTDVWERRLSGGEQQRLTVARALLVQPEWLFLDEATSGLDPVAEAQIYLLLRERLPHTTLVSIAHRKEVARYHNRIFDMEDGSLRAGVKTDRAHS